MSQKDPRESQSVPTVARGPRRVQRGPRCLGRVPGAPPGRHLLPRPQLVEEPLDLAAPALLQGVEGLGGPQPRRLQPRQPPQDGPEARPSVGVLFPAGCGGTQGSRRGSWGTPVSPMGRRGSHRGPRSALTDPGIRVSQDSGVGVPTPHPGSPGHPGTLHPPSTDPGVWVPQDSGVGVPIPNLPTQEPRRPGPPQPHKRPSPLSAPWVSGYPPEVPAPPSAPPARTCHQLGEGLGAGGGDGQRQFVDGHPVGHRQPVDPPVRHLPGQQLPQQHPVTGEGEAGGRCQTLNPL